MNFIIQFVLDLINGVLGGVSGTIQPLVNLIGTTPLEFTTANTAVIDGWTGMTAAADGFLGLFVILAAMQSMYGQMVGKVSQPASQIVPKAILTVILIQLSFILGQDLIILNNELCGLVHANIQAFIQQVNGGQPFSVGQNLGLSAVLSIVFTFSLIRIIYQAVKRIIFVDVLFVLSGPAFLLSFHPATTPWFSYWARTYVATIFTQFLQFSTIALGIQFLIATKQTGPTGFLLAIALLNLAAEIPGLLSRFATSTGASAGGLGSLVRVALTGAALLA